MSPIKEPHFFSPDALKKPGYHERARDWDGYLRFFAGVTSEIAIGEARAIYLWDRQSPGLIRERLPNARIIIMLRDPVDRAYSHYLADIRLGWQGRSVQADAGQVQTGWGIPHLYLELGEYSEQVAHYLETFSQDAVTVLLSDDLRQDAHHCVSEVLQFLGVPEAESWAGGSWISFGEIIDLSLVPIRCGPALTGSPFYWGYRTSEHMVRGAPLREIRIQEYMTKQSQKLILSKTGKRRASLLSSMSLPHSKDPS